MAINTSRITKRAGTRAKVKQITFRPGRWFTTNNGQLIKALSTKGLSVQFPVIGGIYDPKKRRLVGVSHFSPKGMVQGGSQNAPLNIVRTAVAPKLFVEKNLSFNVNF